MRGPVTWPALGLVAVAAASAVAYYKIERERRLENAMGKIVSESSGFSVGKFLARIVNIHESSLSLLHYLHSFMYVTGIK